MTVYDLVFLGILLFSVLSGLLRGGTREIVGTAAFILAVLITLWLSPWLRGTFNLSEIVSRIAFVFVFILTYFGIRLTGNAMAERINKQTVLSYADRILGIAFGTVRALVFLGFIHLLFSVVLPKDKPEWFTNARTYPLSVQCAKTILSVAPSWAHYADQVASGKK